jgi:chitinase
MQLQILVTVAAALLATSTNALPYVGREHKMVPAANARLHSETVGASSSTFSASKRQIGSSSGSLNFVRRSGGQRRLMTASSKDSEKRATLHQVKAGVPVVETGGQVNSGVPGAVAAGLKAATNATTIAYGNVTKANNNGTITITGKVVTIPASNITSPSTDAAPINASVAQEIASNTEKNIHKKVAAASFVNTGGQRLSVGYWAEWTADVLAPEKIAWSKYDVMNYAFAIPNSDGTITLDDTSLLKRMVAAAHASGTKLVLSVGGAGQSSGFVDATATTSAINNFCTNLVALQQKYNLDGFDFDWEYPNNLISSRRRSDNSGADTKQFQTFFQTLRPLLPSGIIMSAAVPQSLWQGSDGNAVGSVARAASALDYIFIMSYDTWGSSSTPGPNSPLANLCGNSSQPIASAAGGVKAWTSAGMPRSKIVLGLPMYGYINTSSRKSLIQRRSSKLTSGDGTTGSGQINFNSIVSQGALQLSGGTYVAGSGWTKYWDKCSDSPYITNGQYLVTYDDPVSLRDKAQFAYDAGLAGAGVWSIDGDMANYDLINALRSGLGKS